MATSFRFKLDPVLRHRRMIEEQKQRDLAEVLREKQVIEIQLRDAQQSITADKSQLGSSLVGSLDVREIRAHGNHVGQATFRAQQLAVKLMSVHRQLDQARAALLEATKARKAIEVLRDRYYERWALTERRREAAAADELGMQAYVRQMQEVSR